MTNINKTNTCLISLNKQRKLVQDFTYASFLRAGLRKNKKKVILKDKVKFRLNLVKQAILNCKEGYFHNLRQQKLEKRIKFTKYWPVNLSKQKKKQIFLTEKKRKRLSKRFTKKLEKRKKWIDFSKWWNYKNKKKLLLKKRYYAKQSRVSLIKNTDIFGSKLNLIIKPNNVFCNFSTFKDNQTTDFCSSGKYNIKVTKKTLRYTYDWVLARFFRIIKPKIYMKKKVLNTPPFVPWYIRKNQKIVKKSKKKQKKWRYKLAARKNSALFITLTSNNRVRKRIIRALKFNFKGLPLIIKIINKKIFNGCRAPKKVRKKRRRMRVFK